MKIKIEEKSDNRLLKRQDIKFLVEHSNAATPPRLDVRAKLAAMLNCKEDQLYIIKLTGLYGQNNTRGYAHLYPSLKAAQSQEYKHIILRHSKEEVPKEKPKPTPKEVKEEAPTEKPKEAPTEKPKEAPTEKPKKGKPRKAKAKGGKKPKADSEKTPIDSDKP